MDTDFYSDKTILAFVKSALCQGDAKLFQWYLKGNAARFRERLARKFPGADLQPVVYACVTDMIRDLVLDTIGSLTVALKSAGDLIVSGGESFNMYFSKEHRIITSDIDTKFVPALEGYENLQKIKLKLWTLLGQHAKRLDTRIRDRIRQLARSRVGRILGISVGRTGPWVTRRFTLIPKKRRTLSSDAVSPEDVLIDVELFALDLKMRHFSVEKKRIVPVNLGGILDIALMRRGEMGYEVAHGRNQGVQYFDRARRRIRADRRILFASRRFLVEDLFLMQRLGLRPNKRAKDRARMYQFATAVLGLKGLKKSDAVGTIFKKCEKVLGKAPGPVAPKSRPRPRPRFVFRSADPRKYARWTTHPNPEKMYQLIGAGYKLPGYVRTSGPFRFDTTTTKWVPDERLEYIKNEFPFRPAAGSVKKLPDGIRLMNTLYGYRANRNGRTKVLVNSALIPLIGLKKLPVS